MLLSVVFMVRSVLLRHGPWGQRQWWRVVIAGTGHIARESNVREEASALKGWHICRIALHRKDRVRPHAYAAPRKKPARSGLGTGP
jgi:hypothetical protein